MSTNLNLNNLMKEAEKMQKRMQEAQKQLTELVVTGESGAGMAKVEMNGRHDVKKVTIKPDLLDEGAEIVGEMVAAAVNDAVRKIEKESQRRIGELTSGINIPNVFPEDKDE
ncbi:MAG: nucleoid-associated protein, YbaB/EbfC family [Legionellales bacterium RIFCSPHIGHO2_12_FULL_37_14]|nr:MAG: nucleoid-associated protein, YbaB/EbfC family [Legionellales bacterium RIFCSPHIGHO2_12_FULL_37_14]